MSAPKSNVLPEFLCHEFGSIYEEIGLKKKDFQLSWKNNGMREKIHIILISELVKWNCIIAKIGVLEQYYGPANILKY